MVLGLSLYEILHFAELAVHGKLRAFHADHTTHNLHLLLIVERVDGLPSPSGLPARAIVTLLGGTTSFRYCVVQTSAWIAACYAKDNLLLLTLKTVERSWTKELF